MKKKLSVLAFIIALMCFLSSCVTISNDPTKLAVVLGEKGYDTWVYVDSEEILDIGDVEFDLNFKNVYCVISAIPKGSHDDDQAGAFLYCESRSSARKLEKALKEYLDDVKDEAMRATVERTGKIVFVGCEDMWEDMR